MNPASITTLLAQYGPWAVVAMEALALLGIWNELKAERKRRDADAQGFYLAHIQNVKDAADRESRFADTLRLFAPRGKG